MIGSTQKPLPSNTQNSQETGIHAPSGIRTHDPRKRETPDPRLIKRRHWGQANTYTVTQNAREGSSPRLHFYG